jgi:hypothetical protein
MYFLRTTDGYISANFIVRIFRRPDGDFDVFYNDGESGFMTVADAEDALKLLEHCTAPESRPIC